MVTVSRSCEQNGQPMARQFASSCGQSSAQQSHFLALPQPAVAGRAQHRPSTEEGRRGGRRQRSRCDGKSGLEKVGL